MAKTIGTANLHLPSSSTQPVRVEIYASVNGEMGDEPLGWIELDSPATAFDDTAALLREIADEF
jgi:hypothetical protein